MNLAELQRLSMPHDQPKPSRAVPLRPLGFAPSCDNVTVRGIRAHLERDGTFVFLSSDTLNSDQLTTLAAGLKPAPTTGSIK